MDESPAWTFSFTSVLETVAAAEKEKHAWRLHAATAPDRAKTGSWIDPRKQVLTLLMGTHPRLGANSPVMQLEENILRLVHSFHKTSPSWSELEAAVQQTKLYICEDAEFSVAQLVHQYREFLALKVAEKDWRSLLLSPPVTEYRGVCLVEKVWHVHSSMACYEEDCMLLTGGYIIEHRPAPGPDAFQRYVHTYDLHCQRCAELDREVDVRCWPNPYFDDSFLEFFDGSY